MILWNIIVKDERMILVRTEKWRQIPGFDRYIASSKGRIISLNRMKIMKSDKRITCIDGYETLGLYDSNKKRWCLTVHKIIAMTFIGPPNGLQVNHKNGNKKDNRVENLEYLTPSENITHAYKSGLIKPIDRSGSKNSRCKINVEKHMEIKKLYSTGLYTHNQLALSFDLHKDTIRKVLNRRDDFYV